MNGICNLFKVFKLSYWEAAANKSRELRVNKVCEPLNNTIGIIVTTDKIHPLLALALTIDTRLVPTYCPGENVALN